MIDMLCSVHSTISFQGFKEDAVWMIEMADEGEEMHNCLEILSSAYYDDL